MNTENPFNVISQQLEALRLELSEVRAGLAPKRPEKKYLSVPEAADQLGVSRITVYRAAEAGRIPTKKVGSRILIPQSFVESNSPG